MTKGDIYTIELFKSILEEGCLDVNPRPHYEDEVLVDARTVTDLDGNIIELTKNQGLLKKGDKWYLCTPAHTLSFNHAMCTYDLSKGEFPIITLRPIAVKTSIAELLWIYQKNSNDLVLFDELLSKNTWDENGKINNWWEDWAIKDENGNYVLNDVGHPHIGCCYGETIRRHNLMNNLLEGIKKDPDGRRHIINMWQEDDFKNLHGLKPCAYQTVWNVRHGKDGVDYLDMCLFQRSSDFATAGCINQVQYAVFLELIARHLGYVAGKFTWMVDNIQIYDRHVKQVEEMLQRTPIDCQPKVWINPNKTNFYDFTVDDIKIVDYPRDIIKTQNPQLKFDLGI